MAGGAVAYVDFGAVVGVVDLDLTVDADLLAAMVDAGIVGARRRRRDGGEGCCGQDGDQAADKALSGYGVIVVGRRGAAQSPWM
jgi:hypothetical protein